MYQMYRNPYEGLSYQAIYDKLMAGTFGWPRWPDTKIQAGYAGTHGVQLLQRAFDFVNMLELDGAFVPDWRALDYGCGWGRFASVLLSKGPPEQLDLCDAWPRTLHILEQLNYRNTIFPVSELLNPDDLREKYDFILSFSVFTHLAPDAFVHNLSGLLAALRPGGRVYVTVRHDEFLDHKYASIADDARRILERDGAWFSLSGGNMGARPIFGDTVVSAAFMNSIGNATYLGQPHSLQHVYRVENKAEME